MFIDALTWLSANWHKLGVVFLALLHIWDKWGKSADSVVGLVSKLVGRVGKTAKKSTRKYVRKPAAKKHHKKK
jgi:hypothetical protein